MMLGKNAFAKFEYFGSNSKLSYIEFAIPP